MCVTRARPRSQSSPRVHLFSQCAVACARLTLTVPDSHPALQGRCRSSAPSAVLAVSLIVAHYPRLCARLRLSAVLGFSLTEEVDADDLIPRVVSHE